MAEEKVKNMKTCSTANQDIIIELNYGTKYNIWTKRNNIK